LDVGDFCLLFDGVGRIVLATTLAERRTRVME
jgi:hypothetical protein